MSDEREEGAVPTAPFRARSVPHSVLYSIGDSGVPRIHKAPNTIPHEFVLSSSRRTVSESGDDLDQSIADSSFKARRISAGVYKPFVPKSSNQQPTRSVSPSVLRRQAKTARIPQVQETSKPFKAKALPRFIRKQALEQKLRREIQDSLDLQEKEKKLKKQQQQQQKKSSQGPPAEFHLHSEERLSKRRAFDAMIKQKQLEKEREIEARTALKKKEERERIEAELEKHRFRARSWKPPKHFHPKLSHKKKSSCSGGDREAAE